MVLSAGGAAFEVGSHARHGCVGVATGDLELDVVIEVLEALIARQLGARWTKHPTKQARGSLRSVVAHVVSLLSESTSSPSSARRARSFLRAS